MHHLVIVGHNPGISELASELAPDDAQVAELRHGRRLLADLHRRVLAEYPGARRGRRDVTRRPPSSSACSAPPLALRHVDREPALRGFLVDGGHVGARLAHRRDHLIERHLVAAISAHRESRGVDGFH